MIRLLRDTLGQRIARMLPAETKADRALREGCCRCPRDNVQPVLRGMTTCATHHEAQRQRQVKHRRSKGIPARVGCPCGVAGHYPVNCPTGTKAD